MFLLAWVIIPQLHQRGMIQIPAFRQTASVTGPSVAPVTITPTVKRPMAAKVLNGGPRQVSLQLKASEPSLRRSVLPSGKSARALGGAVTAPGAGAQTAAYRAPGPAGRHTPEPVTRGPAEPAVAVDPDCESAWAVIVQSVEGSWALSLPNVVSTCWPARS